MGAIMKATSEEDKATSGEDRQGDADLLTSQISFPPELQVYSRGDSYLYFDPRGVNYLLANKHGHIGLEALRRTGSARDAVNDLCSSFVGDRSRVEQKLLELLNLAIRSGIVQGEGEEPRKVKFEGKSEPVALYMQVTHACNLKCVYCYNKEDRVDATQGVALSLKETSKLLADAKELGTKHVVFTGGEPLLREKYVLRAA
jgi:sulfatase maturation enzyme AslB (radical SAM superfamily)